MSPFLRHLTSTLTTAAVSLFSIIIVTRFLARGLGPREFGAYAMSRRIVTLLTPFVTAGLDAALARHLAFRPVAERRGYILAACGLTGATVIIVVMIGMVASAPILDLVLASDYADLYHASLVLLAGYSSYCLLYALYQGTGAFVRANLWQLWAVAVGPAAVAWIIRDVERVVFWMGILYLASAVPLIRHCTASGPRVAGSQTKSHPLWELMSYGLPRVPGSIAFAGVFAVGPILAPYAASIQQTGFLVAGQMFLRVLEAGMAAFGFVALPKLAGLLAAGERSFLQRRITDTAIFAMDAGALLTTQLLVWCPEIVWLWLGESYGAAVPMVRLLLLGVTPYSVYLMLRSAVEAIDVRPVNAHNLYVSLAVTVSLSIVLSYGGLGPIGLAIGNAAGIATLGVLTLAYLRRHAWLEVERTDLKRLALLNAGALGTTILARRSIVMLTHSAGTTIVAIAVFEILLLYSYYRVLSMQNVRWLIELKRRLSRDVFTPIAPS